ncbi:MAG TPA: RyR domain-containing protein, partial [Alphaproteobacteria bacterium]|nr:RyR domain-containing protein [Alphaproteobacteria bacterium]
MPSFNTDRTAWIIILISAIAAFALSVIGWSMELKGQTDVLDVVYRTIWLFKMNATQLGHNGYLRAAQFLAPLVTLSALVQLGLHVFASQISMIAARNRRGHSIICGLGERGAAFVESVMREGTELLTVIEATPSEAQLAFCRQRRIRLVRGNCRDTRVLFAAAAQYAARIIIATPDDNLNLEAAAAARQLANAAKRDTTVQIHTAVSNRALWHELTGSDAVERLMGHTELRPFNLACLAARKFFWDHPIYTYADMRGQRRTHAVFVGFDDYAVSVLTQMMRACPYKDFAPPIATILVNNAADERRKFLREFSTVRELDQIRFKQFDPLTDEMDALIMGEIESEAKAGVTAVFVCLPDSETSLATAIYVHGAMRREARWNAPVFVRMDTTDGGVGLLTPANRASRFDEMIVPFGTIIELSDVNLLEGVLELTAQRIHDAYKWSREHHGHDTAPIRSEPRESDSDWTALPETYRQANRRAADHIKAKLASAGCYVPMGLGLDLAFNFDLADRPDLVERLAMLEHESWCADRRVDGWVHGARRDNRRKIHSDLVPYSELDEATKEYDRDQVRLLDGRVLLKRATQPAGDLIRIDHWVGLVGHNGIDEYEAAWMRRELVESILPKALASGSEHCVTLVTQLAPGSDFVLAKAALDFLDQNRFVHRLLVVAGVPERVLIEDFMEHFHAGKSLDGSPSKPDGSLAGARAVRERVMNARH